MDGAPWVSADVAQGKAWAAAAYGQPSHAQRLKAADLPNFATALTAMTHGRYTRIQLDAVASHVRCKADGRGFTLMGRLGDGADSGGARRVGHGGCVGS